MTDYFRWVTLDGPTASEYVEAYKLDNDLNYHIARIAGDEQAMYHAAYEIAKYRTYEKANAAKFDEKWMPEWKRIRDERIESGLFPELL